MGASSAVTTSLDNRWVRAQFPALKCGNVFFDGPGGTQIVQRSIDAMLDYLVNANCNTHGNFATSRATDEVIHAAHSAMADLLGCDADEVFFGANMTSLTLALSRAIGRELKEGDEIVVTALDHEANVSPWRMLEERGVVIRTADIREHDCTLDMDDLAAKINSRTRLVAVGYASNAVGTINDVAAVAELAHRAGAWCFVDAVHYAPHGAIDVRAIDCDFLACSTYKFFGPHQGVIYGKREHLRSLRPYKLRVVSDELPGRWETGTQNHAAMAGVTGAVEYLAELGRQATDEGPSTATNSDRRGALLSAFGRIEQYERELCERLIEGLLAIPGLKLYGIADPRRFAHRTPTVAVRIDGFTPAELATGLGERGIYAWDGNYYALGLTERLGLEDKGGMLRIGLVHYNNAEEVDRCLTALREIAAAR